MINRYQCHEIAYIWSEENKYLIWFKIEAAFLKRLRGIEVEIPPEFLWVNEVREIEVVSKHDVAAFVQWMEYHLFPTIGTESRFVHYGLTSSDIVDSAFSILIRETNKILNNKIDEVVKQIQYLSKEYSDVVMVGRTHGQAAERIGLKDKLRSYLSALNYRRPVEFYYGRLAGSVGDYKHFGCQTAMSSLNDLGLQPSTINDGQIIHRSVYANYMNTWAVLASVIAKIATDIRLLSQSGIDEVREGFSQGQVGSSSMPQKMNPILSENLCGLARVIRGHQVTAMQNIELWNERDISHSSAERIIFPEASTVLGFMLDRLKFIFNNIVINTDRIGQHLEEFDVEMTAQERMLELIRNGKSRVEAHGQMKAEMLKRKK